MEGFWLSNNLHVLYIQKTSESSFCTPTSFCSAEHANQKKLEVFSRELSSAILKLQKPTLLGIIYHSIIQTHLQSVNYLQVQPTDIQT